MLIDFKFAVTEMELDLETNISKSGIPFGSTDSNKWSRRPSVESTHSVSSLCSLGSLQSVQKRTWMGQLMLRAKCLRSQTRIKDESGVFPVCLIIVALLVGVACSLAAFILHFSVNMIGCLGALNGCHDRILLDLVEPVGIGTSAFFILSSGLSGLCCSLILHSPFQGGIARRCKGGGSGDTKIVIASGATVNGWLVVLRIFLATLYMGGGNPLGTEGPIIHTSTSLAIWLVSKAGKRRRKLLSTFGVIGAAAGISAGFNVHVTGFVYVIEELARTLSTKLALVLAFVAGAAVFVKDLLEEMLHHWFHQEHTYIVPKHSTWAKLTNSDRKLLLLLCVPIGVFTGVAGWIFTDTAWAIFRFLNPDKVGEEPARLRRYLPEIMHLAIVGILCGCLGAIAFEVTGMNGVWGTTAGAIPEAIKKDLGWEKLLLLFATKFLAFILATAASGPGGLLVPSLVTGGFLGLSVAKVVGAEEAVGSACAVIGMGSMFASVMHMPVTGVIIIFELTRADSLSLHIALANFIASNVVYRLPHGTHSFVHRSLALSPTWQKLDQRDFIETDAQEIEADVALFKTTLALWLTTDSERYRMSFDAWKDYVRQEQSKHTAYRGRKDRKLVTPKLDIMPKLQEDAVSGWDSDPLGSHNTSSFSEGSHPSKSDYSSESGLDMQRRRQLREMWESVSTVIPGMNWRLWKSFNMEQRVALTEAASVLNASTPKTPKDATGVWEPNPEPQKPNLEPQKPSTPPPSARHVDECILDWYSLREGPHWAMDSFTQRRFFDGSRRILNEGGTGCPRNVLGVTMPRKLLCKPKRPPQTRNPLPNPNPDSAPRETGCCSCRTPEWTSSPRLSQVDAV